MNIRLVLFDVDGVLTDGRLWIGAQGEEIKAFNAKDGVAVALLQHHGIAVGVVSGKASKALDFRIQQLKFDMAITGCKNKLAAVQAALTKYDYGLESVAFVGDDVIDLSVMQTSASAYAPADAHTLAIKSADYVTQAKGGEGVAREVAEHILLQQGIDIASMYQHLLAVEQ